MSPHLLDRPVGNALTSRQAHLAEGDGDALRFRPDHGVFGAAADGSAASLAALAALIPPDGELWTIDLPTVPPGAVVTKAAPCVQMTAARIVPGPPLDGVVDLTEADAPAMRALAALAQPGPFRQHTNRAGRFVGIKAEGRLVAMAGERLQLDGYSEVSGVCTHPDHRGRGLASGLMRVVAERMLDRGETPFLTAYASNTAAIALYKRLGFVTRRIVMLSVLAMSSAVMPA